MRRVSSAAAPGAGPAFAAPAGGAFASGPAAFSALTGYVQVPSAAAPTAAPRLARLLAHGHVTLNDARVRALVRRLSACLAFLPPQMRTVLRLRSGAGAKRPLSAHAVAHRLHISRQRLAALEARGLRRLAGQSRANGCVTRAASTPLVATLPVSFLFAATGGAAAGGVAGGLYLKAPGEAGADSVPPAEAIPNSPLRVAPAGDTRLYWEVAAAAVVGLLLVAFVIRADMGLGPVWRRRGRRGGPRGG